jgi:tetratricopeptide (TPR) repeat protein
MHLELSRSAARWAKRTSALVLAALAATGVASPRASLADPRGPVVDLGEDIAPEPAPSDEANAARALFATSRWREAAEASRAVAEGETGDGKQTRDVAQFELAVSLYELGFYNASYAVFGEIAASPSHVRWSDTLVWLARLAARLPDPANVAERIGHYDPASFARFDDDADRAVYAELQYLAGRSAYDARSFDQATDLLSKVDKASPYFVKARFLMGVAFVQKRDSAHAVKAFQAVELAVDRGSLVGDEGVRMRDLARISLARTFYSSSTRLTSEGVPMIDPVKLSAAVRAWNEIEPSSELWPDALFEESWAYFIAGEHPRALGNIFALESPYFSPTLFPEADILRAVTYLTNCRYDDARTVVARMKLRYEPIRDELRAALPDDSGDDADERFYAFLADVDRGRADLPDDIQPVVKRALGDRELLRYFEYTKVLDEERAAVVAKGASFAHSPLGLEITDALALTRAVAIRRAGALARGRYRRTLDELDEQLRSAEKVLIDVTTAERTQLQHRMVSGGRTIQLPDVYFVIEPDDEHEVWPFDGEYWRDELGSYSEVILPECSF